MDNEKLLTQLKEIIKKLGGLENALKALESSKCDRKEENGIINLSTISNGATGKEWVMKFLKLYNLGTEAESMLLSQSFSTTNNIENKIVIIKDSYFKDGTDLIKKVYDEAKNRNWSKPSAETACNLRKILSDEDIRDMNLTRILVMHEPINDYMNDPSLFCLDSDGRGKWLSALSEKTKRIREKKTGFAFSVSSIQT